LGRVSLSTARPQQPGTTLEVTTAREGSVK
jgi:hypothetical protein